MKLKSRCFIARGVSPVWICEAGYSMGCLCKNILVFPVCGEKTQTQHISLNWSGVSSGPLQVKLCHSRYEVQKQDSTNLHSLLSRRENLSKKPDKLHESLKWSFLFRQILWSWDVEILGGVIFLRCWEEQTAHNSEIQVTLSDLDLHVRCEYLNISKIETTEAEKDEYNNANISYFLPLVVFILPRCLYKRTDSSVF